MSAPDLMSLLSRALLTRTYLSGYSFTDCDTCIFTALRDYRSAACELAHNARWFALCDELMSVTSASASAASTSTKLASRIASLEDLATRTPCNFDLSSAGDGVARVAAALRGCAGTALWRVPTNYYEKTLTARAALLKCPISALCKTLIFDVDGGKGRVAVLVQYIAKIDMAALSKRLGRTFILAADGAAAAGFEHNGVAPVGALALGTPLPLIVARAALAEPFVWAGGGAADVKVRIFRKTLERLALGSVFDISTPRSDLVDVEAD